MPSRHRSCHRNPRRWLITGLGSRVAGLAVGIVASRNLVGLLPRDAWPYLRYAIVGALAVLAALLVVTRTRVSTFSRITRYRAT